MVFVQIIGNQMCRGRIRDDKEYFYWYIWNELKFGDYDGVLCDVHEAEVGILVDLCVCVCLCCVCLCVLCVCGSVCMSICLFLDEGQRRGTGLGGLVDKGVAVGE